MKHIEHFIPGKPGKDKAVMPRLSWPVPPGVAQAYVEAYTDPAEIVLVPYWQGPSAVREILAAGRRVVAVNFDPALLLALQTVLVPPPQRELDAAVARLGDSMKQGVPLRQALTSLYATTCPACMRPAVVDYYVWDREASVPIARQLRCPACNWDGQTSLDTEDRERLTEIPERGLHYHFVMDRLAPRQQEDAFRNRLEQLLKLYSARNLYALAELTLKIESLFSEGALLRALKALLLECLDHCSSLTPPPGRTGRRQGLSRPARFLERNVWFALEEAANRLRATKFDPVPGLSESLAEFQPADQEAAGFAGMGLVRDLPKVLRPRSIRLILTSPPPLSSAAWSLSYLWGAWLLGTEAVTPLRPLLRQRTPDPTWYARVMAGSLRTLSGLLRDDGRLVLVLTEQRASVVEALLLAASSARMGLASLTQQGSDYRLELMPTLPQPTYAELGRNLSVSEAPLNVQIQEVVIQATNQTIKARGEPVPWRTLHAAIQQRLAQAGLFAEALEAETDYTSPLELIDEQVQRGLENAALKVVADGGKDQELWWLVEPADGLTPLCDRVETAARQILQETPVLTEADFTNRLYARFAAPLTPDAELVAACLRAFGHEVSPGSWQLRTEDAPDVRQTDRKAIIEQLLALGLRLGYWTAPLEPFEVAWFQGDQEKAVFVVRWRAALSEVLAMGPPPSGATPYLVIPGGRAELVTYKLSHNPLWRQAVEQAGWRFIKYRHVRQLADQPEVDEYALRTIIGLDPIVERETAQIPLF